ncbi:MAG: hypothetical protein IGS39_00010 [Calothrix sp. C42_A2020_038]|nr:hypothetical protein [Calothrix sp. C42_A2020_038]
MAFKDIVYFFTKKIPEAISLQFQSQEKPQTKKKQKPNWVEDFDERERNSQ